MGNHLSKSSSSPTPDISVVDYTAPQYIISMDFPSLRKLYKKEYCDKLVLLTSDILERYFSDQQIGQFIQRIAHGEEEYNFFEDSEPSLQDSQQRNRISKFYVKIAHLYAVILMTINPTYLYKDSEGNMQQASLYEKGKIPENAPRDILKLNVCKKRIQTLENKNKNKNNVETDGNITVGPDICTEDEPGIPELENLYFDDKYDFATGTFTGMSKSTAKKYKKDLLLFYQVFTGEKTKHLPPEITKFSDIKLRNYQKTERCAFRKSSVSFRGNNQLFYNYANNLKKMIRTANKNQQALLSVVNQLFVYTNEDDDKEENQDENKEEEDKPQQIRISPELTETKLQELVVHTRALIIKLYLTCEMDYVNGLKMYEAIVEQKILDTSQRQIDNLQQLSEELVFDEDLR